MPTYCTTAKLTAILPSSLPTAMNSAFLGTQITDASSEVDELAGALYSRQYESNTQKFPDITSTPATPKTIEQCALWLALSRCYERLEVENLGAENEATPRSVYFRNKAEKKLAAVKNGEIDLVDIDTVARVETADRYLESATEDEKEWLNKRSEMDVLLP